MKRLKFLLLLATMPSEAFGWIVAAVATRIYPDGLGGFRPESQASITATVKEARALLEAGGADI